MRVSAFGVVGYSEQIHTYWQLWSSEEISLISNTYTNYAKPSFISTDLLGVPGLVRGLGSPPLISAMNGRLEGNPPLSLGDVRSPWCSTTYPSSGWFSKSILFPRSKHPRIRYTPRSSRLLCDTSWWPILAPLTKKCEEHHQGLPDLREKKARMSSEKR